MAMLQRLKLVAAHFLSDLTLHFLIQAVSYDVTSAVMYFSPSWLEVLDFGIMFGSCLPSTL